MLLATLAPTRLGQPGPPTGLVGMGGCQPQGLHTGRAQLPSAPPTGRTRPTQPCTSSPQPRIGSEAATTSRISAPWPPLQALAGPHLHPGPWHGCPRVLQLCCQGQPRQSRAEPLGPVRGSPAPTLPHGRVVNRKRDEAEDCGILGSQGLPLVFHLPWGPGLLTPAHCEASLCPAAALSTCPPPHRPGWPSLRTSPP